MMERLGDTENEPVEKFKWVFRITGPKIMQKKQQQRNKQILQRTQKDLTEESIKHKIEANKKHIKNPQMTGKPANHILST